MDDLTDAAGQESQAERDDWLRHGSSFGTAAAAYAEHRPDYAEAAVRWALRLPGGDPRDPREPGEEPFLLGGYLTWPRAPAS